MKQSPLVVVVHADGPGTARVMANAASGDVAGSRLHCVWHCVAYREVQKSGAHDGDATQLQNRVYDDCVDGPGYGWVGFESYACGSGQTDVSEKLADEVHEPCT